MGRSINLYLIKTKKKMNKDFVPYEEALALNKLKFDKPVLGFRFENNELHLTETECDSIEFSDVTKINGRIAIELDGSERSISGHHILKVLNISDIMELSKYGK
jgi:hypothetical protein